MDPVRCGLGTVILLLSLSCVSSQCSTCSDGKCYDTGECIRGCSPGYVGIFCDVQCPTGCVGSICHIDSQTGTTTCSDGCRPGYCGAACSLSCHLDCVTCDRSCTTCNVSSCPAGSYGDQCSRKCNPNYKTCENEFGTCIKCMAGLYGDKCETTCPSCLPRERDIDFVCQHGCNTCRSQASCEPGYYGASCHLSCFEKCGSSNNHPGKPCNKATGECSAGCQSGYYGRTCNYTCNKHCNSQRCNQTTGECSAGCISGYYGRTCNYTCSTLCVSSICHRYNATCLLGCISGYTSIAGFCEKYDDAVSETSNNLVIILPVVLVLLCAGVGVLVWFILRRRVPNRCRCTERKAKKDTDTEIGLTEPFLSSRGPDAQPPELLQTDTEQKSVSHEEKLQINSRPDSNDQETLELVTKSPFKKESALLLPEEEIQIRRLREKTKDEILAWTDGMIPVSAVELVKSMIKSGQNWITITGNAGDGKTTLGYLMLKHFQTIMSVYRIDEPEEFKVISKLKEDRVVLFDDRFGAFVSDQALVKDWLSVIKTILTDHEKLSNDANVTRVIFVSRKNVVKESQDYLGNCREKMFDPECTVDLSIRKVTEERLNILDYYLRVENLTEEHTVKMKVIDLDIVHGFPHCCKMYSKLKAKGNDINIEGFFNSPLKFLDMTTTVLYNESCKELFQHLIKTNGKFDIYNVKDEAKRQALLKVMKEQEGSYITNWEEGGFCTFSHPSVYESVLNVINNEDPLFCVQHATLTVIQQKMVIATSENKDDDPSCIRVKPIPRVLTALAEKFLMRIKNGNYSVFQSRLCDCEDFCEALVTHSVCTDSNEDKTKNYINKPGWDGQTMLWTALRSNKNTAVCTLVKHGADVNMKNQSGITPLHYLCQDIHGDVPLDIVESLIKKDKTCVKQYDDCGRTPLHYLCERTSIDIDAIRLLLTLGGADVNQGDVFGSTPLHYMCRREVVDIDTVKLMISDGKGDINKKEQNRSTPLHHLFEHFKQKDFLQFLVTECKGDINMGDEHGSTPLHYLCGQERVDVTTVQLVTRGGKGDLNKRDNNGVTPLHYLCKKSVNTDSLITLIREGKDDFNQTDRYGNTPLHYFCKREDITPDNPCLKQIEETNMRIKNKFGHTPSDYLSQRERSGEILPWMDGMIDRSVADVVICTVKDEEKWIPVLATVMTLDAERVNENLQVKDGDREMINMETSGKRQDQFLKFCGTRSSPIPLPPTPSTLKSISYWETKSHVQLDQKVDLPLLEMGVSEGAQNLDTRSRVSQIRRSWCISVVNNCPNHPDRVCIQTYRGSTVQDSDCGHIFSTSHPRGYNCTLGILLDVDRGRIAFIDVERDRILKTFDEKFQKEVYPVYYICKSSKLCQITMKLLSGRQILFKDKKIKLIQRVLSDWK